MSTNRDVTKAIQTREGLKFVCHRSARPRDRLNRGYLSLCRAVDARRKEPPLPGGPALLSCTPLAARTTGARPPAGVAEDRVAVYGERIIGQTKQRDRWAPFPPVPPL